jgi:hypothetical protein
MKTRSERIKRLLDNHDRFPAAAKEIMRGEFVTLRIHVVPFDGMAAVKY